MTESSLEYLASGALRELEEDILPFWRSRAVDGRRGGFIARMSNDLRLDDDAPKGLILNARILWTFAAAYRHTRSEEDRALAERARDYLMGRFFDPVHGGYFWELDRDGAPLDRRKKIYGQAFCAYALAEHHRTFGDPGTLAAAIDAFYAVESHAHDDGRGGYLEAVDWDWRPCADMRLGEGDPNEKKSMNNHLHVLEAYGSLYRLWPSKLLEARLRELIDLFRLRILDPGRPHFRHFFDEAWRPRSEGYTFGHDIEGSWLLCEAAEALGDAALLDEVRGLGARIARGVLDEGLDSDGGLFYAGRDGAVVDANKEWWPQAEAVVGFLNAWQLTKDEELLDAAVRCWRFIEERIVDREHGEWFWRVSREGVPDASMPKVSAWKCPYHNGRACLEILHRTRGEGPTTDKGPTSNKGPTTSEGPRSRP